MAFNSRFEYKFRLGPASYYRALNAIRPFCQPDMNSQSQKNGRYLVRSLYYDNYTYSAYSEKMEGVFHRDKFRIRTYNSDINSTSSVKVENKSRIGYLIHKKSNSINISDYNKFLVDGSFGVAIGDALDEFRYQYFKYRLKPTLIVEYQREAYFAKAEPGLRFSFDHNVQYAWSQNLFNPNINFKPCLQNSIIFEIKSDKNDKDWVTNIIQELSLVSEPNSKYANAFEQTSNDINI